MKILMSFVFLVIGSNAYGQEVTECSPINFVPQAYVVTDTVQGDLNKDNQIDCVFIVKATDKNKIIQDEYRGELDRNRRGIIIALKNQHKYDLIIKNIDVFSSENEDGGVYFAPELSVSINKDKLLVDYTHGRYGYWGYQFRFEHQDFKLIGFDRSENFGPVVQRFISINFLTEKMLTRENMNQNAEGGDEKYEETWKNFTLSNPIRLSEIKDFDELYVEGLLDVDDQQ